MRQYACPTRIFSGPGACQALADMKASRVFLVTDRFFSENGTARKIGQMIPGAEIQIFDKVVPDPPASLAAEGAALCAKFQPQLLVALGGGSPMDCAKAIRLAAEQAMTFVAIPTTSGSGSEVTSFSILTHNGVKHPLVDSRLRPDAAILDEDLLQTLPATLIADTGMDLLAHCLEALAATGHSSMSDALAMRGAQLVLAHLADSYYGDKTVRGVLHEAACMAGMAFDNAGLGVCHALAHALGGIFHIPHGRLCAMLLPHVLQVNEEAALDRYAALARSCGLSAPTEKMALRSLISAVTRLRTTLQLPAALAQAGVTKQQWQAQEQSVLRAALEDPCCRTNPVPVTEALLRRVLQAVKP